MGEFLFPFEAQLIQKLNLEGTARQARWDSSLAETTVTQKEEEKMEKLETHWLFPLVFSFSGIIIEDSGEGWIHFKNHKRKVQWGGNPQFQNITTQNKENLSIV